MVVVAVKTTRENEWVCGTVLHFEECLRVHLCCNRMNNSNIV